MKWLSGELVRFRIREHQFVIRRLHGAGAAVALIIGLVIGFGGGFVAGYHYPYRTLPRPPLPPGQTAPSCGSSPKDHTTGSCLPQPKVTNAAAITATTQGCDLSNNDPVYSSSAWAAIAAHNAFCIVKVTEGTSYIDPTAAPMAAQGKAHGLVVGGFDFLHVCGDSPEGEAGLFVAHLKADGLTGPGTLPGTGDAEYGGSGCDVRTWLLTWAQTVNRLTGRWPMFYTGAWWWQPHAGAYWPNPSLAWISGYGVRYPYMPSGRSQLDIWQFSDAGWNGATSGDLSIWRDGAAAFLKASSSKPPGVKCFGPGAAVHDKPCAQIRPHVSKLSRERIVRNHQLVRERKLLITNKCRVQILAGSIGQPTPRFKRGPAHNSPGCKAEFARGTAIHARITAIDKFVAAAIVRRY